MHQTLMGMGEGLFTPYLPLVLGELYGFALLFTPYYHFRLIDS